MRHQKAARFIDSLYRGLLARRPGAAERACWINAAIAGMEPAEIVEAILASAEYIEKTRVRATFPPGHFHSPIVDPQSVREYHAASLNKTPADLPGICVDVAGMHDFWARHREFAIARKFPERPQPERRFHYEGAPLGRGDAIILRLMMSVHRPRRIVEIGSGYSTACMLDTADEIGMPELEITCIEPFPDRLRSLLRPADYERVRILRQEVQRCPLDIFARLRADDFVFIDSTHVMKTGSDVHFAMFDILPCLAAGVLIHVHDCPFPFEYAPEWIFKENYSWNEAYALRAFLMYNAHFEIKFWVNLFAGTFAEQLREDCADLAAHPGSSIWLLRRDQPSLM